ncbi:MAG TPA: methyltransferase domain-containing protein [Methanotrichaceae archaeon]|nr:methyltransferase domain-containing protein [Methanotrichaceae archaeon]
MSNEKYFDQVASQWDGMRSSFFSEAVRDKAISVADPRPGELAADIGCGTGFITEGLIHRGLKIIAVDQSQAMLDEMKSKLLGIEGIEYRLGGSERLPIQDQSLDYAFANMYLHHVESPQAAIKEMTRALNPGGKLIITDLDEHSFEFLMREHHDRWMGFKRESIQRWFEEAGLKKISLGCVGENCCAASSCGSEKASISIFVASGMK